MRKLVRLLALLLTGFGPFLTPVVRAAETGFARLRHSFISTLIVAKKGAHGGNMVSPVLS